MASSGLWEPINDDVRFRSWFREESSRMMSDEWLPVLTRVRKMARMAGVKSAIVQVGVTATVNVCAASDEVRDEGRGFSFHVYDAIGKSPLIRAIALSESSLIEGLVDPKDEWDVECAEAHGSPINRAYF